MNSHPPILLFILSLLGLVDAAAVVICMRACCYFLTNQPTNLFIAHLSTINTCTYNQPTIPDESVQAVGRSPQVLMC